jgi:hypothetical protein
MGNASISDADLISETRGLHWAAGKGDKPRNVSRRFKQNYGEINWGAENTRVWEGG